MSAKGSKSLVSKREWKAEEENDSDWESFGEDATEAWEASDDWRAEMGVILNETSEAKPYPSYKHAAAAGGSLGSRSNP